MNVSDIMERVKRQFGDESGVQVTDSDILRWINSGMRQIVLQNESLLEETSTTDTSVDLQLYSLPVDLLNLKGVHFRESIDSPYRKLKGYSVTEFNERIDDWDSSSTTGIPLCYTVYDSKIILYPVPDIAITAGLKVYYNRSPVEVSLSTDIPELPTLYHEALVKYSLQQAYEMDEDWDAVGNKAAELDKDLDLLRGRESWKVQESYPTITVLYEDM